MSAKTAEYGVARDISDELDEKKPDNVIIASAYDTSTSGIAILKGGTTTQSEMSKYIYQITHDSNGLVTGIEPAKVIHNLGSNATSLEILTLLQNQQRIKKIELAQWRQQLVGFYGLTKNNGGKDHNELLIDDYVTQADLPELSQLWMFNKEKKATNTNVSNPSVLLVRSGYEYFAPSQGVTNSSGDLTMMSRSDLYMIAGSNIYKHIQFKDYDIANPESWRYKATFKEQDSTFNEPETVLENRSLQNSGTIFNRAFHGIQQKLGFVHS